MFCKLVFYVYSFSADSNMSRSSFKTVPMCKKEIQYRGRKKHKQVCAHKIVKGQRLEFWKPTFTTQFYPVIT